MSNERLPECPFCGGEARIVYDYESKDFYVCCSRCFCETRSFATEWAAILMWNTRKPMERIVERLENELELADKEKERSARENPLQFDSAKGYATGIYNAIQILKGGVADE